MKRTLPYMIAAIVASNVAGQTIALQYGIKANEILNHYNLDPNKKIQITIDGKTAEFPRGRFLERLLSAPLDEVNLESEPAVYPITAEDSPLHRCASFFAGRTTAFYDSKLKRIMLPKAPLEPWSDKYKELVVIGLLADSVIPRDSNLIRNMDERKAHWAYVARNPLPRQEGQPDPRINYEGVEAAEVIIFERAFRKTLTDIARNYVSIEAIKKMIGEHHDD